MLLNHSGKPGSTRNYLVTLVLFSEGIASEFKLASAFYYLYA